MSTKILTGLENIDDDLDLSDIPFVKLTKQGNDLTGFGVKEFPAVLLFKDGKLHETGEETHDMKCEEILHCNLLECCSR